MPVTEHPSTRSFKNKPKFPDKPIPCETWEDYDRICAQFLHTDRKSPKGYPIYKYAEVLKVCIPPSEPR